MSDAGSMPVVNFLSLDGDAHLVGQRCVDCGAVFLGRRSGCARCSGMDLRDHPLSSNGVVRAFTVVHRAPPPVVTPFMVGVVDLDGGGTVKANLIGFPAGEDSVVGVPVRLTTFVAGTRERDGAEIISFGYSPA